jgi:hypothetical protein
VDGLAGQQQLQGRNQFEEQLACLIPESSAPEVRPELLSYAHANLKIIVNG